MLAHRLRHRIAFEYPRVEQDSEGNSPIVWVPAFLGSVPLDSVPAEVLTGAGREPVESGSKQTEVVARINLRWFPGLDQSWRVLWDGNIFNIISKSTDLTGRREWRLVCSAGLSDGR